MKSQTIHSRKVRYGSMTVFLTVTLIAALVLANVIFSTLANYFAWYVDMTPDKLYSLSDRSISLIGEMIDEKEAETGEPVKIEILFAEDYRQYETGSTGDYVYNTAHELELAFPDNVEISWFNCWVDKKLADELGVTSSTNVVLRVGSEKRVFAIKSFFTFASSSSTTPIGYDGERAFANTLSALLFPDRPLALIAVNHDEVFYDDKLFYALRDAGYAPTFFDLYRDAIPDETELLVIYNPNADMIVADGVSESSEIDAIDAYLQKGKNMMVFLSSSTPIMPNFEAYLAKWGVSILRSSDATGREYNCMVKDAAASLTSDGFTVRGVYATEGRGSEVLAEMLENRYTPWVIFPDSTVFTPAEGFSAVGTAYRNAAGTRTLSALFTASESADAWANGSSVATNGAELPLMVLAEDSATGGKILAVASIDYADEAYVQSAVYGNLDVILYTLKAMGNEDVLTGLHYKPFADTSISNITTRQMLNWTLGLTITPALLVLAVATFVLVRRKYA